MTQKTEPWDAAKPFYETLYGAAQTAFNNTDRSPYAGDLYAGPTQDQQQALSMYRNAAAVGPRMPEAIGANPTNTLAMDTINGKYMMADSNPYLASAVQASINPVQNQLMRTILPSLQDQSIQQGAYGGSGYGTAQGLATSDFTQQALDMASKIYAGNYAQERAYQMQAPTLFAQAQGLQDQRDATSMNQFQSQYLLPAQLLDQAGSQQQSWNQAGLDANLQRYNINQAAPWSGLGEWAQVLNGGGFNSVGGTTSSSAATNPLASFLQGASGIAGIGSSLFPKAAPAAGNWLSNLFSGGGFSGSNMASTTVPTLQQLAGAW